MRKIILPLIASLAVATPALANETRAEVRGGVIWSNGESEDTWGAALGYDFDLGKTAFAGVEASGDKIGASDTKVSWGIGGRLGLKAGEQTKLYATGGWNSEACELCDDSTYVGGGVQQGITDKFYIKAEYRHNFFSGLVPDSDAVVAGVGLKF